jgi:hypothetical protein
MNQDDFDKLKLLANSTQEYIAALQIKLIDTATKNGHDMNKFYGEPLLVHDYCWRSHCRKCPFDIEIENINGRVYIDEPKAWKECFPNVK